MDRYFQFIIKHQKAVIGFFALITAFCVILTGMMEVEFTWREYLPEDAASVISRNTMEEEFSQEPANLEVQIQNVSVPEALEYKKQMESLAGVQDVLWLDDVQNVLEPLEFMEAEDVESWYQNKTAFYQVTVSDQDAAATIRELRRIAGMNGEVSGSLVEQTGREENFGKEMLQIILVMIPVLLLSLILAVNSWGAAVLAFLSAAAAVLLNGGTNLILGKLSFLTAEAVLFFQIPFTAVCSLILLRGVEQEMEKGAKTETILVCAGRGAAGKIGMGALLLAGVFLAFFSMRFQIGKQLCVALIKALLCSLICVLALLPALLAAFGGWVKKTGHSPLHLEFGWLSKMIIKLRIPILVLMVPVLLISFQAAHVQDQNGFTYQETVSDTIVMLVPKDSGALAKGEKAEIALNRELNGLTGVKSVVSYVNAVGNGIPSEYMDEEELRQFYSANYSRLQILLEKGAEDADVIQAVRNLGEKYYGDKALLAGEAVEAVDMESVCRKDGNRLALLAVILLSVILIFVTESWLIPVLQFLVICLSGWMNQAAMYFLGESPFCISFQCAQMLQLCLAAGFSLVLAVLYLDSRKRAGKKKAVRTVVSKGIGYLLLPTVLTAALGCICGMISEDELVRQLSSLSVRGTVISFAAVILILPGLLFCLDRAVEAATFQAEFYRKGSEKNGEK